MPLLRPTASHDLALFVKHIIVASETAEKVCKWMRSVREAATRAIIRNAEIYGLSCVSGEYSTRRCESYNTYAHRIVRFREIVAHSFQDIRNSDHGIDDRIYSQKGVSTLSDKVATRQKQPVDAPNWSDIDARRSSAYWLEISSNVFGERSTRNKLWCNCELSNAAE